MNILLFSKRLFFSWLLLSAFSAQADHDLHLQTASEQMLSLDDAVQLALRINR